MNEISEALAIFLGQIYLSIDGISTLSLSESAYMPATNFTVVSWLILLSGYVICMILQSAYNHVNFSQER